MNSEIKKIINEVANDTPDWSNWRSHQDDNALVDEGEYVKVEDVWKALEQVALKVYNLYNKQ